MFRASSIDRRARFELQLMRPPSDMDAAARGVRRQLRLRTSRAVSPGTARRATHGPCDVGGAIAVGEQSIVADAVQALGQHVRQKAPNELAGWQSHGLIAIRPLDPVILPRERDAGLVG